jgi:hypothetical protein
VRAGIASIFFVASAWARAPARRGRPKRARYAFLAPFLAAGVDACLEGGGDRTGGCPPGEVAYHDGDYCPGEGDCREVPAACRGVADPPGCAAAIWCDDCVAFYKKRGDTEVTCSVAKGVVQCCHSLPGVLSNPEPPPDTRSREGGG